MSITEHRAPFTLTPTDRESLHDILAKAERLARELSDAYREAQRIVSATTDLAPHVDLGDPLAMYRLPSGMVGYETTHADEVKVGDWIQASHGDPGWHLVTDVQPGWLHTRCAIGDADGVLVTIDDDQVKCWALTDALRIARRPENVVADQERKAGAA